MRLYIITAQRETRTEDGGTFSCQVPTFFLDADIQGIVDEAHAEAIARGILDPKANERLHIHAARLS